MRVERLGEALRPKIEEYLKAGKQIDKIFLEHIGSLIKDKDIVDVEKYVKEAEREKKGRNLEEK